MLRLPASTNLLAWSLYHDLKTTEWQVALLNPDSSCCQFILVDKTTEFVPPTGSASERRVKHPARIVLLEKTLGPHIRVVFARPPRQVRRKIGFVIHGIENFL